MIQNRDPKKKYRFLNINTLVQNGYVDPDGWEVERASVSNTTAQLFIDAGIADPQTKSGLIRRGDLVLASLPADKVDAIERANSARNDAQLDIARTAYMRAGGKYRSENKYGTPFFNNGESIFAHKVGGEVVREERF